MEIQNNRYTAFVPARSGSKRLKDKNIKLINGKPLVVWTLESVVNNDRINKVIFSTDSLKYWDLVNSYIKSKKLTLDFRDESDASDNVKIFDYIKNKAKKIFTNGEDVFILTLPTAPLRQMHHIDEAINLFEVYKKPIFSATEFSFPISFAFKLSNENWLPIFKNSPMITGNTRSQDQEKAYRPNGAIYIRKIDDLHKSDLNTLYCNAIPYIMMNSDSVDIDNEFDFIVAEAIMKSQS